MRHSATLLLAGAGLFLSSCASTTGSIIPASLQQPLSAGVTREYQRDFETVVRAAKIAIGMRVLKTERPDARTAVIFGGGGAPNPQQMIMLPGGGGPIATRIVVEQLATGGVAVRIVQTPRTTVPSEAAGGTPEMEVFRRIEWQLNQ
jgi:hypothetical protein